MLSFFSVAYFCNEISHDYGLCPLMLFSCVPFYLLSIGYLLQTIRSDFSYKNVIRYFTGISHVSELRDPCEPRNHLSFRFLISDVHDQ